MKEIPTLDGYFASEEGTIVSARSGVLRPLKSRQHKGSHHVTVRVDDAMGRNARCENLMVGDCVVGLQFLYPGRFAISRKGDGTKEYRYTEEDGRQRIIPASRVWTIPGWSLDGKTGVSVIHHGAQVFGAALATDEAASGTFRRGLMPTTWFKHPKFAVEGSLRADSAARAAFYSVMVNNGILTRDEVRELEDRAPMGGNAAVLTVQTALAPLDSLGSNTADEQARNAMANWLKDMMASTADT